MNQWRRLTTLRDRVRSHLHKLRWGVSTVGPVATLRGSGRLALLKLRKPESGLARLRSGGVLAFDYPSQLVPALVLFGDVIDPEFAFLALIANKKLLVMDVGAAIGQFSVFAALLPNGAVVHAFEPSDENVKTLRHNIDRNGVGAMVTVHQMALGDYNGEVRFSTAEVTFLSRPDRGQGTTSTRPVPVRTLDTEAAHLELEHVDVLKVNVAGFEPAVLKGASNFLAGRGADILILLIGTDSLPWYESLREVGYRFFFYHPLERQLYDVPELTLTSLAKPPWPARHLIAIHEQALQEGILEPTVGLAHEVRPLARGGTMRKRAR